MITGQEQPDSGSITIGETVQLAYVDQSRDALDGNKTVWEEISGGNDIIKLGKHEMNSRAYCSAFNFKGGDQQQKVGTLSGGQRNRVHLAKLLKPGGNVLLLDEPTNDLDTETLAALEEALENYAGCAVVISHDRMFLDRLATHILAFEGNSHVEWFEGNFQDYEEDKKRRLGEDAVMPKRIKYKQFARVKFQPLPGQHGMARINGGPQVLVDGLLAQLPAGVLRTGQCVTAISQDSSGVEVEAGAETFSALQVIVAAPLRVACSTIRFSPALAASLVQDMQATPTWMSVHAKAVVVYETAFWREAGLSGRIASRAGPLVEAHDLCGADGTPAAIFGFVGWPHDQRARHRAHMREEITSQLARCFGSKAANPLHFHVEDWADNPQICTPQDKTGAMPHPDVASPLLRQAHGRVQFAVSETSDVSPGLIEGAFAAGMRAASLAAN
jgi:ABC-type Mn2+/Zn2+ transport system ATPase subunit